MKSQRATASLAVCAPYHDDAAYLPEWIEFHRLMGAERFYLYNNLSTDDHREVLRPYVEAGVALVHEWPLPAANTRGRPTALVLAFERCLSEHGHEARWIAFLDVDEFLFSPTGKPLPEVLADYERSPGVCVSRANYGMSGHKKKPGGLVIESYLHRRGYISDVRGYVKCVVDPSRTVRCATVHHFAHSDGFPVDENHRTIEDDLPMGMNAISYDRLRVNHYGMKSEEELERKRALWERAGAPRARPRSRGSDEGYDFLDPVLADYAPAVRAALERAKAG